MDFNTCFDFQASDNSREAADVRFMYFSPEEVRRVSAHEINDIAFFDEWGEQLDRGLYAPQLGPLKLKEDHMGPTFCRTCGLEADCPGHMGHIELATTCYNPFLLTATQKLLSHVCLDCRKFTASDEKTAKLVSQFTRLGPGELAKKGNLSKVSRKRNAMEAECDPDKDERPGKKQIVQTISEEFGETIQVEDADDGNFVSNSEVGRLLSERLKEAAAEAEELLLAPKSASSSAADSSGPQCQISACTASYRAALSEYCKTLPNRCERCNKAPAKWRKQGWSALFLQRRAKAGREEDDLVIPLKAREYMRDLWKNEAAILWWLVPGARELGAEMYFLENILVPPNRFRPCNAPESSESAPRLDRQTQHLMNVLAANAEVRRWMKKQDRSGEAEEKQKDYPMGVSVRRVEGLEEAVEQLQTMVNSFMDSGKSGKHAKLAIPGIRQLLERKEGLFRMKMMGKRVNFAARSVISPDPNIETSEIGIPLMIAEELTYPEVAANHNADWLRRLVERGAKYPGAKEVHTPRPNGGKIITKLTALSKEKREALAKQLITDIESGKPPMTVFRQLRDGDPLLVNRQPTLHKPGIMAHVAKVMKKEKTIRLHYVNCNTYNADFDGDEMNLHAPQDPIGRMEALSIAKADRQYLVPTSGKPLRGLIQDHCIAGAMLSKRDTFFARADVCFLLYTGLRAAVDKGDCTGDFGKSKSFARPWVYPDLRVHMQRLRLRLDPPCVLRPHPRWSGKQVFSMLLKNLVLLCSHRKAPCDLNLESNSKTPGDMWNGKLDGDKEESSVLFCGMDLLRGVLDKAQFGASSFGLTHILHELLGGNLVGLWFASLARLLTSMLQMRGFTCAFADLLLTDKTEVTRKKLISDSRQSAKGTVEGWLSKNKRPEFADGRATPEMISEAASDLLPKSKRAQEYEGAVIGKMKENWSDLINMCIPVGQKLPFPRNCFAAMVQTGAKGSKVNQSQVSCCLGQQELEGRLPPLMCTYRSLPCFAAYDMASRTRGYIADRFLTGIRPQEFFFHCMAGREGLVDTAVKTSRSGYLQRCLIKHLESLKVAYDHTVRDADGSVLQFLYGEDGADVTRASYLFNFKALQPNLEAIKANCQQDLQTIARLGSTGRVETNAAPTYLAAREALSKGNAKQAAKKLEKLLEEGRDLDGASRHYLQGKLQELRAGVSCELDPLPSVLSPGHFFGATSEKHDGDLKKYLDAQRSKGLVTEADAEALSRCMQLRFMQSLAQPGEAVGVIAAQSMGEPSTQMTLNTFHLAGHGGANVTLGIPRLREIVQTASKTCSTPLMQVKVLKDEKGDTSLDARLSYAQRTQAHFRHMKLMDCLRRLAVHEELAVEDDGSGPRRVWTYTCRFMFFNVDTIHAKVPHINKERLEAFMRRAVVQKLNRQLTRVMKTMKAAADTAKQRGGGEEGEVRGDEEGAAEGGQPKKRRKREARGEEDKAEAEEALDAEVEAEEKADADDQSDASSGMYSEKDDEEGEGPEAEAEDEAKDEEAKEEDAAKEEESGGEGGADEEKAPASPGVKAELGSDDDETPKKGKGGSTPKAKADAKKEKADTPKAKLEAGKSKAGTPKAKSNTRSVIESYMASAREVGNLVWYSPLENDEMTIIVRHTDKQCPHSLFVGEVLHKICKHSRMQDPSCQGVKRVHVKVERGEVILECEGINLFALHVLGDCVDNKHVYTNNIQKVLHTFGVEAARASVVKEIRGVFGHYGIEVDHRHLSLISDYMSQAGGLRAFNRGGMGQHSASPIQQMSFETTMQFMTTACQDGLPDPVASPASSIVLGQLPKVGTGMVSLIVDLNPPVPKWKQKREFTF